MQMYLEIKYDVHKCGSDCAIEIGVQSSIDANIKMISNWSFIATF